MARLDLWQKERESAELHPSGLRIKRTIHTKITDGTTLYLLQVWRPKATNPSTNYAFRSEEHRERYLAGQVKSFEQHQQYANERKAERAKPHTLKVGDILDSSWGYDQTNIDYYEVIDVPGPHTVRLRELAQNSTTTAWMQGDCTPIPGKFTGPPTLHRVGADNGVRVRDGHGFASLWDGKPNHWTSYA